MYGSLDVDSDTSDTALFKGVAARLPENAVWFTSPLKRTHQTAQALIDNGICLPGVLALATGATGTQRRKLFDAATTCRALH